MISIVNYISESKEAGIATIDRKRDKIVYKDPKKYELKPHWPAIGGFAALGAGTQAALHHDDDPRLLAARMGISALAHGGIAHLLFRKLAKKEKSKET